VTFYNVGANLARFLILFITLPKNISFMKKNPTLISSTSKEMLIISSLLALFAIGLFQLISSSLFSIESVLILFGACNLLGAFAFFYYQKSRMISFFLLISFFSFFIVERSLYFEGQNKGTKSNAVYKEKSHKNKELVQKP
jgi:hypothetical protein